MADYYVLSQLEDDVSWVVYSRRTFIACTLSGEKIRRLADFLGCITGDYGKELGHGAAIVGYGTTKDGTKVILGHLNGEKNGYN
ncbi:hypothetical protein D5086_023497 [Populus alba]|uniref:Uncharacterized protein n=1 Tax=Populus alba TaxID=43335 RepID=A0ACC4BAM1_POPAL